MRCSSRSLLAVLWIGLLGIGLSNSGWAQSNDEPESEYGLSVEDAAGNGVDHEPPTATFTAYLNGNSGRIITDQTPLLSGGDKFSGTNSFNVDFGVMPEFSEDDTVYVRFTDNQLEQQDLFSEPVSDTDPFNDIVRLEEVNLPERPDVQLDVDESDQVTLTWEAKSEQTYQVYRRPIADTLQGGQPRYLYRRVAKKLTEGQFVEGESGLDSLYAYIVYAKSDAGVHSSHSKEVVEPAGLISGLHMKVRGATNATLDWEIFPDNKMPLGETMGYNLYRREEGGSYGEPVGFTGVGDKESGTVYTDTRLEPGKTYYYQVKARNGQQEEYGQSEEVAVTTKPSTNGTYTYANLKVAVAIYQHTNEPEEDADPQPERIPDEEVEDIKELLQYIKTFYWRNSEMKLNVEYTFYVFEEYKEFTKGGTANQTAVHLAEDFGVVNTQYDYIFRVGPAIQGFWSIGARKFDLPQLTSGEKRRTGFAQVHWPKKRGYGYPFTFTDIATPPAIVWTGEHEMQHVIDAVYRWNDHEEMGHGDQPQDYGKLAHYPEGFGTRFGTGWDFQATMFRDFSRTLDSGVNAFEDLNPDWGGINEASDQDGDNFPDTDSLVALDEARFGSSTTAADTDEDGYTDRQEAIDGIFHYSYSDPRDPDTDGDGVPDGEDKYPRYSGNFTVAETEDFTPSVDGDLSEWPHSAIAVDSITYIRPSYSSWGPFAPRVYMAYGEERLYMAISMDQFIGAPFFQFDFGADGRWRGADNTQVRIDVSDGDLGRLRTWDAGEGMWDGASEYRNQYGRIFSRSDIDLAVKQSEDSDRIWIELSIPKNEKANLKLQSGEEIGFTLDYVNPGANRPRPTVTRATTFDKDSYAYVSLAGGTDASQPPARPETTELGANYPNPFQGTTVLPYTVAEGGSVTLAVYDVLGRRVATLVNEEQAPGQYSVRWDGTNYSGTPAASGVYVYRLEMPNGNQLTRKITLVR